MNEVSRDLFNAQVARIKSDGKVMGDAIFAMMGKQMAEVMAWQQEAVLMGAKMRDLTPDEQKAMAESERLLAQASALEEQASELRDKAYDLRPGNLYPIEQRDDLHRMWRENPEEAAKRAWGR